MPSHLKPVRHAAPPLHVGLVESDSLRALGYSTVLEVSGRYRLCQMPPEALLRDASIGVWLVGNVEGWPALRQVEVWKRLRPDLRLLVVGRGGSDADVLRALSAGAKGYIDEAATEAEFLSAIGIVAEGSVWAPRRLLSQLLESVLQRPSSSSRVEQQYKITPREMEVLELLVEGRSNRDIAEMIHVEERTIKAHVAKLLRKTGVENRIALTMHAIHHGLLDRGHSGPAAQA